MKKVEGKCYEKKRKKFIDIKKANTKVVGSFDRGDRDGLVPPAVYKKPAR